MNRDFVLPATPGRARVLMRLANITRMNMDPAIAELAKTGLSGAGAIVQSILDFGLRCIVPGNMDTMFEHVVEAAKIDGLKTIVIVGQNKHWLDERALYAKLKGFTAHTRRVGHVDTLDSDFIRENRDGLVVFEPCAYGMAEQTLFAHSFPKAIALSPETELSKLNLMAQVLFPNSPTDLLEPNFMTRREFEVKGFTKTEPEDFAFLLNIVTDHLEKTTRQKSRDAIFGEDDLFF